MFPKCCGLGRQDLGDFVKNRRKQLVDAGVAVALVALTSVSDSESTRELLSKVFRSLAEDEQSRGLMMQQGSVKVSVRAEPRAHDAAGLGQGQCITVCLYLNII